MEEVKNEKPESNWTLIDKALTAAAMLKEQNDRKEILLKREEELMAKNILGGRSEAGIPTKHKTQEELDKEQINLFLKETGRKI